MSFSLLIFFLFCSLGCFSQENQWSPPPPLPSNFVGNQIIPRFTGCFPPLSSSSSSSPDSESHLLLPLSPIALSSFPSSSLPSSLPSSPPSLSSFPFVLVNCTDNSAIRRATEKENLLETHGDSIVILSSANTFSHDKRKAPLSTYFSEMNGGGEKEEGREKEKEENGEGCAPPEEEGRKEEKKEKRESAREKWYFFGDNNHQEWEDIFSLYEAPPLFGAPYSSGVSFGIGEDNSGVPFHIHGPVFAEVFHGEKRWFLAPPEERISFDPDITSFDWVNDLYPSLRNKEYPLDIVLGPNEILFIPDQWWHATLNRGDTVFISVFL